MLMVFGCCSSPCALLDNAAAAATCNANPRGHRNEIALSALKERRFEIAVVLGSAVANRRSLSAKRCGFVLAASPLIAVINWEEFQYAPVPLPLLRLALCRAGRDRQR